MSDTLKLHLGSGEKYLEGYVNIDYPPSEHTVISVKADVYTDIRALKYPDGTVDEIRSHHLFEHFSRAEALTLLLRWRRWLKPGGKLVIETPDFGASARAYAMALGYERRMQLGRHMLGSQEAKWAYHLDFWDAPKFKFVLKRLGFKNIRCKTYYTRLAQKFPKVPLINVWSNWMPDAFSRKYGGHKLPNIVATAKKDGAVKLDEKKVVREILSSYLVGKERDSMLNVWLGDVTTTGGE